MNYFKKTKMSEAICIIIELTFRKTGKHLFPEDSYRKRKYNKNFLKFEKIVTANVRSLLQAHLNEVG